VHTGARDEPMQGHGMTSARGLRRLVLGAALLGLCGCAPPPVGPGGSAVPPTAGGARRDSTAVAAGSQPVPAARTAMNDSLPTAEAERVLATIPEPLSPSQRVPPPAGTGTVMARAPGAAYDTLRATSPNAGDSAAVPVPAPTQPLGTNQEVALAMPDTLAAPAAAATGAGTAPPAATTSAATQTTPPAATTATATAPTECWRVQVSAPDDKAMADSRSAAAQSLLLVPMAITFEKGLYKVRTRDCMARDAADALKQRAQESGFSGAFLVNAAAAAPAAKPKPKSKSASTKHSSHHTTSSTKPK